MSRKFLLFSLLILLVPGLAFAQYPGGGRPGGGSSIKGRVTGTVVDDATGETIEFATIAIKKVDDGSIVTGGIAEAGGEFRVLEVPLGQYNVEISFVGYEPIKKSIELTPREPDADLGRIALVSNVSELNEVVVEGERAMIENRIDKVVYNANQDVANAGGTAADVLRRTPLLSVDLEGNVSLRGSQNVTILLNGKPSSLFSSGNVAAALNSLPADQIENVEVITSPSAKYDGEGSAGIINIVTKKKNLQGIAGNVNASIGNRQNNGVVGLNAGRGRFGFNLNGNMFYGWPRPGTNYIYQERPAGNGNQETIETFGESDVETLGFFTSAGAYYDFNAYHSINSSFRFRGFSRGLNGGNTTTLDYSNEAQNTVYQNTTVDDLFFSGYEGSLDYIWKFPSSDKQELSASYQIDGNIQDRNILVDQSVTEGVALAEARGYDLVRDEQNNNEGDNTEHTLQLNYAHPFGSSFLLETGAKGILRRVVSTYNYDTLNPDTQEYVRNASASDVFSYQQDVWAGFVQANWTISDNWSALAGVRYENTTIGGSFRDNTDQNFAGQRYDNWLPSVTVSRKLANYSSAKASYTRRIQRPGLQFINPYQDRSQNFGFRTGNPDLAPEVTDQYELTYSTFVKGSAINASVFYRRTNGVITNYTYTEGERAGESTFLNIGVNNSYGVNVFASTTLFKIWTIRGGADVATFGAEGTVNGETLTRNAIIFNGNVNSTLKLPKDWTVDMFGFYRAPRQTLQGFQRSFSLMGFGVQKQIWDKKGAIGLRVIEPFSAQKTFGGEATSNGFTQVQEFNIPFRSIGVSFRYQFGKIDGSRRARRSRINNDDVEDGGGNAQSGGFGR